MHQKNTKNRKTEYVIANSIVVIIMYFLKSIFYEKAMSGWAVISIIQLKSFTCQ